VNAYRIEQVHQLPIKILKIEKERAAKRREKHGGTAPGRPKTLTTDSGVSDRHESEAIIKAAKKAGVGRGEGERHRQYRFDAHQLPIKIR
jgi:hypothetical protein